MFWVTGCKDDFPGYHFNGSLSVDGFSIEHIELYEGICGLVLKVEKGGGRNVYFIDSDKDTVADIVRFEYEDIFFDTKKEYDNSDDVGKRVLTLAQPEFERYWHAIETQNIKEAKAVLLD